MTQKILNEVLSLPMEDRAQLVDVLIRSLNSIIEPEIEEAWKKEAESRFEAYNRGEISTIDGEEFMQKLRNRFQA